MSILDQQASTRRDIRNDHSTDEVPSRGARNKGRRKVCKKSPSRKHSYAPKDRFGIGATWDACVHCGKYL